tara:strand:+ start:999 stop:1916 length:918 start_codon:yes stop_codon:yes gene_type:complete
MTDWTDLKLIQKMGVRAVVAADSDELEIGQLLLDVKNGVIYAIKSENTTTPGSLIYKWSADTTTINLEMDVISFTDNQASPQLIGDDAYVWKDGDDLTFDIGYNQAPDSASIGETGSPSSWSSDIVVPSPYTSATSANGACLTPTHDVKWPSSVAGRVYFKVTAVKSGQSDQDYTINVQFLNEFCIGVSTEANHATFAASSPSIRGLGSKTVQSGKNGDYTVTAGAGEYIYVAYREALGLSKFEVGGFDGGFQETDGVPAVVENAAHVNSAVDSDGVARGFTEKYNVYRSTNAALGAQTITVKNP